MKNKYLVNNGYYIKDDLSSFLLYFDHFSQGITLPIFANNSLVRKIAHRTLRLLIILIYVSKIYKLKYKMIPLRNNAIIMIKGKGKWSNKVKLIRVNGQLRIVKKVFSKKIYLQEKRFYNTYKNNTLNIKLPKHIFQGNNTIEMEFLPLKSFQRLMFDGTYDLKTSLAHFKNIKEQIKQLYGDNAVLVHGDLGASNIFIYENTYYLIDFTDSHVNNLRYDLYTLLYSILSTYRHIQINEKTIADYSFNNVSVNTLLETNNRDLIQVEKQFITYREARFPGVYYS